MEYHGVVNARTKVVGSNTSWMGFPITASTILYCDNQSSIQVVDNLVSHSKMKYVELHFHYLRPLVHENIVTLFYCRTDNKIVDILIKPLSEAKFLNFCSLLGLQEVAIKGAGVQT